MFKLKIKKDDHVIVITGKDKGKTGKVIRVLPKLNKAIVAGINLVKVHTKPSQKSEGGIITKESLIDVSNIAIFDDILKRSSKICFKSEDGIKRRFIKKSERFLTTNSN